MSSTGKHLTGNHERSIDSKNRLQIPASFRPLLVPNPDVSNSLYVMLGERPHTLSLVSEREFDALAGRIQTEFMPGREALDFEQRFYSATWQLDMDKQGRVVLPENLTSKAGLTDDVVLAGARRRVDIWRKRDYEAFMGIDWDNDWPDIQGFLRGPQTKPSES